MTTASSPGQPRPLRALVPVLLVLVLAALGACVGVDASRESTWEARVAQAPDPGADGRAVDADADDDRFTAPLLGAVPGAWPRVDRVPTGAPNVPYWIGESRYVPTSQDLPIRQSGIASWYGEPFHGRLTATGEVYDMHAMTAAHPTMPLPSYALVRHVASGREVIVRVNDRGPFVAGRVIDLSLAAAQHLGIDGIARVEVIRLTHDDIRQGRWLNPAVRLASADLAPRP